MLPKGSGSQIAGITRKWKARENKSSWSCFLNSEDLTNSEPGKGLGQRWKEKLNAEAVQARHEVPSIK